jgi:hypothetical protein
MRDLTGAPIATAPKDGTPIIVSIMRRGGVPDSGHYCFERVSYRRPEGLGVRGWHPIGQDNMTYGESGFIAWWPDGTPEEEREIRPRTNFKWRPSNGSGGMAFYDEHCARCFHEKPIREDYENAINNGLGCNIFLRTMAHDIDHPNYPSEWTDIDGEPKCTAYQHEDAGEPRCTETIDMFEEKA